MSLMGTLTKIAIGYAAARGVDKFSGGQGLGGLLGGAAMKSADARTQPAQGTEGVQAAMSQMGSQMAALQQGVTRMAAQQGFDLSALTGGAAGTGGADKGLLSVLGSGGGAGAAAGLGGLLAAFGGAAGLAGQTAGSMADQVAEAAPDEAEDAAGLLLRAMIQATKADGQIDPEEQQKILDQLGQDASQEEMIHVQTLLAAPVDIDGLAADTPDALKLQVYSMSLMPIRVDTAAEAQYLDQLANALGLNQQIVNALHTQMGTRPLYG